MVLCMNEVGRERRYDVENYIKCFCDEFDYPLEAKQSFIEGYQRISENETTSELFHRYVLQYQQDRLDNYDLIFPVLEEVSKESGVHTYTVQLLFFICLSEHLRDIYQQKNIEYNIYYDSMCDLKWKLRECHDMYGVWGSFVAWWFREFFELKRFAFGRLQFELMHMNEVCFTKIEDDYTGQGVVVKPEDIVVSVHIPSSGPLRPEDCQESYQRAAEFFKDSFVSRPVIFLCASWLLNPDHPLFLPKDSNILKFAQTFDIFCSVEDETAYDTWRIFNKPYNNNPEEMPCNTSMQRAYLDWLKAGNKFKCAVGIYVYQ